MKKFLYLDYDEIKSILAQNENGVIEKIKEENQYNSNITSQSDFKDLDKLKNFFNDDEIQKNNIEQKINDLNLSCEFNNYEIMLSAYDGFIIPMNTKCLLENPKNFGFLFEGEFNCVGIMTNLIGKDIAPIGYDDISSLLRCRVNEALINFLPTKEEVITVIKPIAIYYDTD